MERKWITGFTQYELGIFKDTDPRVAVIKFAIQKKLKQDLENSDDTYWVITGGQSGIEQWAAASALELKAEYPQLQVSIMTPYQQFGSNWKQERQDQLQNLIQQVDFSASVSPQSYQNAGQLQNYQQFMLTHTDNALLFYDEQVEDSKVRFAQKGMHQFQQHHPDYDVFQIDFEKLQDFAEEYADQQSDWS
ncbi:DUF1273 family protein [Weissella viridescens]|uniref:DUF1273 family protein n=1 Tax=Weissella viridescens TaxID=1629 RepID=A0A3P2RFE0_WEIVI|nr:SLOG family protein [Weissella viridescens]RRG18356.1 DUF1273 family protein [Weissella viridescens]